MSALQKPDIFADRARVWPSHMDGGPFPAVAPSAWAPPKPLRLINLSPSGFIACDGGGLELGETISLDLPGIGPICARVVRRERHHVYGRFMHSGCLRLCFVNGLHRNIQILQVRSARAV